MEESNVSSRNTVLIFDTTLRDGEQSPGATLTSTEKLEIAAQLARLGPYVVITHIEGEPVKSVDEFKKRIAKLREDKKEKTKLTVSIMGKSRFADLKLED